MPLVKATLLPFLLVCSFALGACSRSENTTSAQPTATPNLRADAERLQNAINKAAEQRKQQGASPSPSP